MLSDDIKPELYYKKFIISISILMVKRIYNLIINYIREEYSFIDDDLIFTSLSDEENSQILKQRKRRRV